MWLRRLEPGMSSADIEDARTMLFNYAALPLADQPTLGVEVPFLWRGWAGPGLPDLGGLIDRIALGSEGRPVVVDYKSNRELSQAQFEIYSHQLRLYAMAQAAMQSQPTPGVEAAIVMLRTGTVLPVDCGDQAMAGTMRWASELAQRSVADRDLSGLDHPARPCASCAYAPICPDRRRLDA